MLGLLGLYYRIRIWGAQWGFGCRQDSSKSLYNTIFLTNMTTPWILDEEDGHDSVNIWVCVGKINSVGHMKLRKFLSILPWIRKSVFKCEYDPLTVRHGKSWRENLITKTIHLYWKHTCRDVLSADLESPIFLYRTWFQLVILTFETPSLIL